MMPEGSIDKPKKQINKKVSVEKVPVWALALPQIERDKYIFSPQCKVCTAKDTSGQPLRHIIEGFCIEGKTHVEICNIMNDQYGLQLMHYNISNHMLRHAPNYAKVIDDLMTAELGEVLKGKMGPVVDQYKLLLAIMQVGMHNVLKNPESVGTGDAIRAAEKFHLITEGLKLNMGNQVSQEDITTLLDIMQTIMTPEQRAEVRQRFHAAIQPLQEPDVPVGDEEVTMVEVDGEMVDISTIPTLPPEEDEGDDA